MEFVPYNVLNPVIDTKKPFLSKSGFLIFNADTTEYKYYLECSNRNAKNGDLEYLILLSKERLNKNYRSLEINDYGKYRFKPKGEMMDFIKEECKERGNIAITLLTKNEYYSVFKVE